MFSVPRPVALLRDQVRLLESHLAAVRDGDEEGVHQARVATRRVRELLPLISEWYRPDAVEELTDQFRQVGRSLGAVRDADVQTALLRSLEARIPTAAPTLVLLRQQQEHRRLTLMRTLIKDFEVDRLVAVPIKAAAMDGVTSVLDLPCRWREEVERFFVASVAFEGKDLKLLGWLSPAAAEVLLRQSMV